MGERSSSQMASAAAAATSIRERQLWDKLKANHPDALQLLRTKDGYRLYNEDAVQGGS